MQAIKKQQWPVEGIRIQISGPLYKGKRKRKSNYHMWVNKSFHTGHMPNQSWFYFVDYYQKFTLVTNASLGIKVWLLFKSTTHFLDP